MIGKEAGSRRRIHRRLYIEELEARVTPSAFVVADDFLSPPEEDWLYGDGPSSLTHLPGFEEDGSQGAPEPPAASWSGPSIGPFDVIVESGLLGGIQASLDVYAADLTYEGYTVSVYEFSGTASDLRTQLQSRYTSEGLVGALFVGDAPYQNFKSYDNWDTPTLVTYPHDLYFMDLDGSYVFSASGVPDEHTAGSGDVGPEIYVSRITTGNLSGITGRNEVTLINDYFAKVHDYRQGVLTFQNMGIVFADDDWSSWGAEQMNGLYSEVLAINNPAETTKANYLAALEMDYESILECIHSSATSHSVKGTGGGTIYSSQIVTTNPGQAFYNMFNCSSAKFTSSNYLAGAYVYGGDYGLNSIGSAKTGSMLYFPYYYEPQGLGASVGEAFQSWFDRYAYGTNQTSYDWAVDWFYGMTMQGDPTLRPLTMGDPYDVSVTVELLASSDSGVSNSDNITNVRQPIYSITVSDGGTIRIDWDGDFIYDVVESVAGAGTYWYAPAGPLPDGSYPVNVAFTDWQTHTATHSSPTLIDATAPGAPNIPDLDLGSDTGVSFVDNITNDATPTLNLDGFGTYYRLFRGAAQISGDYAATASYTEASPLADGAYNYTIYAVDAAGNVSTVSPILSVTIDTISPAAPMPLDGGPDDLDPDPNEVLVASAQPVFLIQLNDGGQTGINDATVTASSVRIVRDGVALVEGADYSFGYEAGRDRITLTSVSGSFGGGVYSISVGEPAGVIFDNAGNELMARTFRVEINASHVVAQLPDYGQDFSSGKPAESDGWEYYSSAAGGRITAVNGALRMDSNGANCLNEAVLHLDLSGVSNVELQFKHRDSTDEPHALPAKGADWESPHQNGDGVAISDDGGITWRTLVSLGRNTNWTTYTIDLDQAITKAGMSYTSNFLIKFQQYDNQWWGLDGREFDDISVRVVAPPPIDYHQDFSSGRPGDSDGWEYYSSVTGGRIEVVSGALRLDSSGAYVLNEAILHLNLAGQSNVQLQFRHRDSVDEPNALPVKGADWASAHQNGDGVAISADGGITWRTLVSLGRNTNWVTYTIDLDQEAAAAGMTYTSDFLIKFQQYDNQWWGLDGREFDDISVKALSPPVDYAQDFSSGKPGESEGWDYYSSPDGGRIAVVDGALRMDSNGTNSLNEAILHLDLTGQSDIQLQFRHRDSVDEFNAMPTGTWTGHQNGDGVAISDDGGATWYSIVSLSRESSWTQHTINLDEQVAAAGMSYTSIFLIKFQQYDNHWWGLDGREFDDISVRAI